MFVLIRREIMNDQISFSKKDLILSLIVGEIAGWLLIVLAKFIFPAGLYASSSKYLIYLPIVFPIVCLVCLYIAYLVSKLVPVIYQFAKFILIGGLNFLVDSGITAILILGFRKYYQIEQDTALITIGVLSLAIAYFALYKSISFVLATTNSYFWNKFWTFKRNAEEKTRKEFGQFLSVSIIGFLINVGIAYGVFRLVEPIGNLNKDQWTFAAVVVATTVSMIWNFLGYKFIVFDVKKDAPPVQPPETRQAPPFPPRKIV